MVGVGSWWIQSFHSFLHTYHLFLKYYLSPSIFHVMMKTPENMECEIRVKSNVS